MRRGREEVAATIKEEGAIFADRLTSGEAKEAVSAFFQKRRPDFSQFN
jgi:enoyl-CoA hydratase/carnithine racemase